MFIPPLKKGGQGGFDRTNPPQSPFFKGGSTPIAAPRRACHAIAEPQYARRGSTVHVFWNTRDWARAIAEMPAEGPLPARTVLVPRERVAHALRRELIRIGQADVLNG